MIIHGENDRTKQQTRFTVDLYRKCRTIDLFVFFLSVVLASSLNFTDVCLNVNCDASLGEILRLALTNLEDATAKPILK